MQQREALLKDLVDLIAAARGTGLHARSERAALRMLLQARLGSMQSAVQDFLASAPSDHREILAYRIRVLLPLYSHLAALLPLAERGCPVAA